MTARTTWNIVTSALVATMVTGCGSSQGKVDDPTAEREERVGAAHITAEVKGSTLVATETLDIECRARSKRYAPWKPCGSKPKVGEQLIVLMGTPTILEGTTDASGQVTFDLTSVEATPDLVANKKAMVIEKSKAKAPIPMPSALVGLSSCSLLGKWKDSVALIKADRDASRKAEERAMKDACDKGDGASCDELARRIELTQLNSAGQEAAIAYYRKACDLKHEGACRLLKAMSEARSSGGAGKIASTSNGHFRQLITVPAKSTVSVKLTTTANGTWASPLLLRCQFVRPDLSGRVDLQVGNPCVTSVSNTGPMDQNIELAVDACDGIEDQGRYGKKCRPVGHDIDFSVSTTTQ